jgi:hypothetical protein
MLKTLNLPMSEMAGAADFITRDGADQVVLWAPAWSAVQPAEGGVYDMTQFALLDQWSEWVLHVKKPLLVAVPCDYPTWSYGVRSKRAGSNAFTMPPDDLAMSGGWARYIAFMMRRYPRARFIVLNEPEYAFSHDPLAALHTSWMMRSAADIAHASGHAMVLGPATATSSFAKRVLHWLYAWKPPVRVCWAHHHYRDVDADDHTEVAEVLSALGKHRWRGGRSIWLTEGGYIYRTVHQPGYDYFADPAYWWYEPSLQQQERFQLDSVVRHYRWCRDLDPSVGKVECWANYEYVDALWGGWASGLVNHDGLPHPLHEAWLHL